MPNTVDRGRRVFTGRDSPRAFRAPSADACNGLELRLEQVEAPEVVFDWQDLTARKPSLACVLPNCVWSDHGPRASCSFPDHADRQAVEDAETVVEPLHLACWDCKGVLGT